MDLIFVFKIGATLLVAVYSLVLLVLAYKNSKEATRQQNWSFKGKTPNVSILIALRNEEKNLPALLDSLGFTLPESHWEVLLLDDHSTDGGQAYFEKWKTAQPDKRISWHVLPKDKSGKK
jgi:cellulose synthase/poly-beta-1,6-N-acetylglucosamine synthase-like glycosyltransferase